MANEITRVNVRLDWAICPHTSCLMAVDEEGYSHDVEIPVISCGRFSTDAAGRIYYASRSGHRRVLQYGYGRGRCDRNKLQRAIRQLPLPDISV